MATILADVKKALGIAPDYPAFDTDILMHINGTAMTLRQLGVKTLDFEIEADTEWTYFLNRVELSAIKTYIPLDVRIAFDPPSMSFQISAIKDKLAELQWRITEQHNTETW